MGKGNRPCSTCRRLICQDVLCERWRSWFADAWDTMSKEIRDQCWRRMDDAGRQQNQQCFVYSMLHEIKDPCAGCVCKTWCDTPCSLRLVWWDRSMTIIRNNLSETIWEKRGEEQ